LVVRFDRATQGAFAKQNGELDASRVAEWQAQHGIDPADGKVSDRTVEVAEGHDPTPPSGGAFDQAAAEAYNRAHVPQVVRFDRATGGAYAKINGELDALRVAQWQQQRDITPADGKVTVETVLAAEAGLPAVPQVVGGQGLQILLDEIVAEIQTIDGQGGIPTGVEWQVLIQEVQQLIQEEGQHPLKPEDPTQGALRIPVPMPRGAKPGDRGTLRVVPFNGAGRGQPVSFDFTVPRRPVDD
jgi:hypothetical protein